MKKLLCAAVAVTMAATMAFGASNAGKAANILVWESNGPEKEFIQWAIKEFRAMPENKKIKITYQPVESTDSRSKIELDGPAGVGADIFVAPHDHIGALVTGGHVLPIDDGDAYIANFTTNAEKAAKYNGGDGMKYYGYPLGTETYVLLYNKSLIKENEVPKTWEDAIAFAKKFNNPAENKYALVWPVVDGYYGYMFMESFGAPLFGPNGNDRKQHNLNSPAAVKGLTYFQSLKKSILPVEAADASGDFCNAEFTSGKAAMIISGPWSIKTFEKAGVNFGLATLPAFPGSTKPATSFSGVRLAFVSSYSQYPEAAKSFAKFLTSKKALEKRFEITSQIPPRKDIDTNTPLSNPIKEQLKTSTPMPTIPQLGTYWSAMGSAYSGIWNGDDVKKTLDAAASAMESAK